MGPRATAIMESVHALEKKHTDFVGSMRAFGVVNLRHSKNEGVREACQIIIQMCDGQADQLDRTSLEAPQTKDISDE